ncbi:hypothetical protein BKA80DRAFT_116629 [Phyllosticta citrichinensis]
MAGASTWYTPTLLLLPSGGGSSSSSSSSTPFTKSVGPTQPTVDIKQPMEPTYVSACPSEQQWCRALITRCSWLTTCSVHTVRACAASFHIHSCLSGPCALVCAYVLYSIPFVGVSTSTAAATATTTIMFVAFFLRGRGS